MTCPCCDEIVTQMRAWKKRAEELEVNLKAEFERRQRSDQYWREQRAEIERIGRSNASLRGALTKARKRIAELKESQ